MQWGNVHKLYKSYPVSMFAELPMTGCTRDPESSFSVLWDLLQVAPPLRASTSYLLTRRTAHHIKAGTRAREGG